MKGKTATRTLTAERANECRKCIENHRKLEEIITEMKRLSVQFIERLRQLALVESRKKTRYLVGWIYSIRGMMTVELWLLAIEDDFCYR